MSKLTGQRLKMSNLTQYLDNKDYAIVKSKRVLCVPSLRQADYGKAGDCTLTSLTAYLGFLYPNTSIPTIYNRVEAIAKKFGYNGETLGTIPIFIRTIFNKAVKQLGNKNIKTKVRYFKDIGWNYNDIIELTHKNIPAILNLWDDGRKYYNNHSILIVGYLTVKVNGKNKRFLQVFDNWTADYSLVDYDKLCKICTINYV